MTDWRARLASGLVLLVLLAGAVRLAYLLLAPATPGLVVLGVLAAIYLFMWRPSR